MGTARDVLVIVPAFDEQDSVGSVIEEVHKHQPDADILVVDDGSADATAQRARLAGAAVLRLPFNLGVGGAMRAGFLYAVRNNYRAAVQVDADGQHDPQCIADLLRALNSADVVVGSRFAGRGSYRAAGPRRWAMRLLALGLSVLCRTRLTDVTSGFRAAGPRALALFAFEFPVEYLGDTVESLVVAHRAGLSITEVPVLMRPRLAGQASQNPLRALGYLLRAGLVLALAAVRPAPKAASHPALERESA